MAQWGARLGEVSASFGPVWPGKFVALGRSHILAGLSRGSGSPAILNDRGTLGDRDPGKQTLQGSHSLASSPETSPGGDQQPKQTQNQSQSQQGDQGQRSGGGSEPWATLRRLLSASLLLAPPAIAFGLGTWQLQRRAEKAELVQRTRARLQQPPLDGSWLSHHLTSVESSPRTAEDKSVDDGEDLEFRRVVVRGCWSHGHTIRVGPRVRKVRGVSEKGYVIVTPLLLPPGAAAGTPGAGGEEGPGSYSNKRSSRSSEQRQVSRGEHSLRQGILVNRGWAPEGWRAEGEEEAQKNLCRDRALCPRPLRTQGVPGDALGAASADAQVLRARGGGGGEGANQGESECAVGGGGQAKGSWISWLFGGGGGKEEERERGKEEEAGGGEGEVMVVGVLRGSEIPNMFVPFNQPDQGLWFFLDAPAMAQSCGLHAGTPLVEALATPLMTNGTEIDAGAGRQWRGQQPTMTDDEKQPLVTDGVTEATQKRQGGESGHDGSRVLAYPWPRDEMDLVKFPVMPQDHLNYALTWYSLALATAIMAYLRLRSPRKRVPGRQFKIPKSGTQPL